MVDGDVFCLSWVQQRPESALEFVIGSVLAEEKSHEEHFVGIVDCGTVCIALAEYLGIILEILALIFDHDEIRIEIPG